jgi:hypothetical protein
MGGAALVFGVDSVRKDNHLICGQPVHQGLILGNKRSLFGFIGLCRQQFWFLIREPQAAHQLGGS